MKTRLLSASTIQLLRFHFSLFLMPVYWFALSQIPKVSTLNAILVFVVLHLLVYPSSNGYNSYMDRDTGSVGGIKNPLQPTKELFYITLIMDTAAVIISCIVSMYFAIGILLYVFASKLYSFRGIRLKQFSIFGQLTVIFFQGAFCFGVIYHGCSASQSLHPPILAMLVASLLIGGFYPLTQIYQHKSDLKDGVITISYRLGVRGTFIYSGLVYILAIIILAIYFFTSSQATAFYIFGFCILPVGLYFLTWARKVWRNSKNADYHYTMQMSSVAALCTNMAFIFIFFVQ